MFVETLNPHVAFAEFTASNPVNSGPQILFESPDPSSHLLSVPSDTLTDSPRLPLVCTLPHCSE